MTEKRQDYFRKILVPVSRPDTATLMIDMATRLVDSDEGEALVLVVTLDASEEDNQTIEVIEPICERFQEDEHSVELLTVIASSVSRGILDTAREQDTDAILMGAHISEDGNAQLGGVVENVMQAAPCDVLVYRFVAEESLSDAEKRLEKQIYRNILVPKRGVPHADIARRIGKVLSREYNIPFRQMSVPVTSRRNDFETYDRFALQLASFAQVLSQRDNLLVLGFPQESDEDRIQSDDLSDKLLEYARGSVLLVIHPVWENGPPGRVQRFLKRMNPILTTAERNELVWQAKKYAELHIDYLMMIVLSAALASLGLLINSAAVIIGAMLVAPLMQPLAALAIGLTEAVLPLTLHALRTLFQGVVVAFFISLVVGILLPFDFVTSEMMARGNPTLLDAGVAFVSGLVAAYATARKGIPVALAGVAIAAALMPPLTTIGLGLAIQNTRLALGASLLFLANILFIILAQYLVFFWLGMRPGRSEEENRWTRVWWVAVVGALLVVVAVLFDLSRNAMDQLIINQKLENFFAQDVEGDFRDYEILEEGDTIRVIATVRVQGRIMPQYVQNIESALSRELNRPVVLDVVALPVVGSTNHDPQIRQLLQSAFPGGEIVDYEVESGETIRIVAILRIDRQLLREDVRAAQEILSAQLQKPVMLEVVAQPVIRAGE